MIVRVIIRKGSKKKLVEFSTWVGGVSSEPIFHYYFFFFEKNMSLKHLIVPKDHLKTHLFFSIFGWGTLISLDFGPKGVSNL